MFKSIDIIYKPTKSIKIELLCFFPDDISKAYSSLYSKGNKRITRAHQSYQCYYCNKIFIQEIRQKKKHIENCSGRPGVVYNFNNQNLISYQDNFHAKDDAPIVIYFDFETTERTEKNVCPFICDDSCF